MTVMAQRPVVKVARPLLAALRKKQE